MRGNPYGAKHRSQDVGIVSALRLVEAGEHLQHVVAVIVQRVSKETLFGGGHFDGGLLRISLPLRRDARLLEDARVVWMEVINKRPRGIEPSAEPDARFIEGEAIRPADISRIEDDFRRIKTDI